MPDCTARGTQLHTPCRLTKSASGTCAAAGSSASVDRSASRKRMLSMPACAAQARAAATWAGIEVDRGDRPVRIARRQDQRAEALAAAELQIAHRIVRAGIGEATPPSRQASAMQRRRLMPVVAGHVGDVGHIAAAPAAHAAFSFARQSTCCASITSASNTASAASARRGDAARRPRDPGVPAEPRRRIGGRVQPQRRHLARRQHRIDGEPELEADIGAHQRHQPMQRDAIRQQPLEALQVERADAQDDARLRIPGPHAGRGIDPEPAPRAVAPTAGCADPAAAAARRRRTPPPPPACRASRRSSRPAGRPSADAARTARHSAAAVRSRPPAGRSDAACRSR